MVTLITSQYNFGVRLDITLDADYLYSSSFAIKFNYGLFWSIRRQEFICHSIPVQFDSS